MGIGQMSARERVALSGLAFFIFIAVLYAALWEPGLKSRERLSAALPKLRAQLEDMKQQKQEVEALRKALGAAPPGADLRALLRASAERSAIRGAVERIEWRGEQVLVVASSVAFDPWLEWVRGLQRELGVRVVGAEIKALPQPGLVRVEAVFGS